MFCRFALTTVVLLLGSPVNAEDLNSQIRAELRTQSQDVIHGFDGLAFRVFKESEVQAQKKQEAIRLHSQANSESKKN